MYLELSYARAVCSGASYNSMIDQLQGCVHSILNLFKILKIKGYLSNRHSILSPKYVKKGGFLRNKGETLLLYT